MSVPKPIKLSAKDKAALYSLTTKGTSAARVIRRARVLLLSAEGMSRDEVSTATGASVPTVGRVRRAYLRGGIDDALYEKTRSGRPCIFGDAERKKIIALACSKPPDGIAVWTCELLAQHCGLSPRPDKNTIHLILKADGIKPWLKKNVVRSKNR